MQIQIVKRLWCDAVKIIAERHRLAVTRFTSTVYLHLAACRQPVLENHNRVISLDINVLPNAMSYLSQSIRRFLCESLFLFNVTNVKQLHVISREMHFVSTAEEAYHSHLIFNHV